MDAPIDLRKLLDMGIARGDSSPGQQPQARAELYGVVARLRWGIGDYREADALLVQQAGMLANRRGAHQPAAGSGHPARRGAAHAQRRAGCPLRSCSHCALADREQAQLSRS